MAVISISKLLIKQGGPNDPNVPVAEEDLASLLYTSGTTGRPKGAMMTHRNWCFSATILTAEWRILPRHRFFHVLSPFFSGGIGFMTIGAFRGITLVLCDWNTEKVMKVLQEEKINYSMFAPAMTSMIVNHPDVKKYDFSAMERIITSAAPISPGLLRKATEVFGDVYTFTYGTSETALGGCQCQFEDVDLNGPTAKRIAAVGKAMMGMNVRVVDDNGNDIPWGSDQMGEVVVSGPDGGESLLEEARGRGLERGHVVLRRLGTGGRRRLHLYRGPQKRYDLKRRGQYLSPGDRRCALRPSGGPAGCGHWYPQRALGRERKGHHCVKTGFHGDRARDD